MVRPMSIRIVTIVTCVVLSGITARAATETPSPQMPFTFVENRGQAAPSVRYLGTVLNSKRGLMRVAWFSGRSRTTIKIAFERSSRAKIRPDNPIGARANYLYGSDPRQWRTDLPLFGSIHYTGIWPGVDLTYNVEHDILKAEYLVAPGAGVERILLRFDGDPQTRPDGTLWIHGVSGSFVEDKPLFYQSVGGERREVAGGFHKLSDGAIGFWTAEYDRTRPLVIDPAILFSGYFGGSSQDNITAVGIDALNNVVTAGWTSSNDLPASTGARASYSGSVDAFVASFLPNGGTLIYCTYLGGSGDDRAFGLAIDSTRNVYVTGWTSSTNFPLAGAVQTHLGGTRDAFVTKLNRGRQRAGLQHLSGRLGRGRWQRNRSQRHQFRRGRRRYHIHKSSGNQQGVSAEVGRFAGRICRHAIARGEHADARDLPWRKRSGPRQFGQVGVGGKYRYRRIYMVE